MTGETYEGLVPIRLTARPSESEQPGTEVNGIQELQRLRKQPKKWRNK